MSKNINVMYSHNTDDWRTPSNIYDYFVNKRNCIDLFQYRSSINQFDVDYTHKETLFCNPPFSKMNIVVDYVLKQYDNGCNIILLLPARTDTKWFHKLLLRNPVIYFISGRLHYNDSNRSAPFPSLIMFLDHKCFLPLWSSAFISENGKLNPI